MGLRRIWLCADDYGIAPGVNAAIRDLVSRGRINAVSVMVVAPHFDPEAAAAIQALNTGEKRVVIGLHVTLTAPYAPMSTTFGPIRDGKFLPLGEMMRMAVSRRLPLQALRTEIAAQLQAFSEAFGRAPDFIDGHQHVQLLPQVRDAFLNIASAAAPRAWVRQCGRASRAFRFGDSKGLLLDLLSVRFRRKAGRLGARTNPAFAGAYAFSPRTDYARIFPRFLDGLPDGGLVMCHPGFVDAELSRLDPLTTLREREFAFFSSDNFSRLLAKQNVVLARPDAQHCNC